jgi:formylglycine-generating enzyme required for sulfatase activity
MHGNVLEWVQDCRNDSYAGAPSDGSAWTAGNCASRALRGGAFDRQPRLLRSAVRDGNAPSARASHTGFRVARILAQQSVAGTSGAGLAGAAPLLVPRARR